MIFNNKNVLGYIIVLLIFLVVVLFIAFMMKNRDNLLLKETIRKYEENIKEKEAQIDNLQSAIDSLMFEQAKMEQKIRVRKEKVKKIKKELNNSSIEEVCYEFKKLNYNPNCK